MADAPLTPADRADVLIVGGGVAGLYCAWRLLEQRPERRVVVVERLSRTGGRLDSDVIRIQGQQVHEEEGGMRFNSSMTELLELLRVMGLCADITPFPMIDPGQGNRFCLRGRSFTVAQAKEDQGSIWSRLYHLKPNERKRDPMDILGQAFGRVLTANGADPNQENRSPAFWQRLRTQFQWNGVPLNQWQLWGLLADMGVSEECITAVSHVAGFQGPFRDLANAGATLQVLEDFANVPRFYTMRRGLARLPDALADRVRKAGGQILLDTVARSLVGGAGFTLEVESSGRRTRLAAPQVILALPSGAMGALLGASPPIGSPAQARQLGADVASVRGMAMLKIILYYDQPWWHDPTVNRVPFLVGPSFTDLPLNAVYPFLTITGSASRGPAALTIYCDFDRVNFWCGLQVGGPRFTSPLQREHASGPHALTPASTAVVQTATRQLAQLFDTERVPDPLLTSFRYWSDDDEFGAAYHLWGLGADDPAVMRRLVEPVPGLFVANEAWSDMQGWVNGALRSADLVLERFGITSLAADSAHPPCGLPLQPTVNAR